jgi:hypothetical protein
MRKVMGVYDFEHRLRKALAICQTRKIPVDRSYKDFSFFGDGATLAA